MDSTQSSPLRTSTRRRRRPANSVSEETLFSQDEDEGLNDNPNQRLDVADNENLPSSPGHTPKSPLSARFLELIENELYRGYDFDRNSDANIKNSMKVVRFMQVPRELEKFMGYGFLLCCNCFLEFFTFLPLRALLGTIALVPKLFQSGSIAPGHARDLLRIILILISTLALRYVDISYVYHTIRGEVQSVIKLYVLFNVFDIFNKLCSSFGQDILDALYFHTARREHGVFNYVWISKFITYFSFACVYIVLHALVNLMQFTTLNVAINSSNYALLTIIISTQFVELKGSVFKRFGRNNLFQITCSDCTERFQILVFLFIVGLKNTAQIRSAPGDKISYFIHSMLPVMALVFFSEILVDWIKHSFVTRFNGIDSVIYREFTRILYKDVAKGYRGGKYGGDYSQSIVRRLGLAPIPLACLMIVAILPATTIIGATSAMHWILIWVVLFCAKMSMALLLLGQASEFWVSQEGVLTPTKSTRSHSKSDVKQNDDTNELEEVMGPLDKPLYDKDKLALGDVYRFTMTNRIH